MLIKIKEAIVVEGTYDKIKLGQLVDAVIVTTNGFDVFKNKKRLEMIKTLAAKTGIVILTDADRAGFLIRNYLKQHIEGSYIKHAYIPSIKGKEKRKSTAGKEGLLGVEGINNDIIRAALEKAGCMVQETKPINKEGRKITKTDFYADGLTGHPDSRMLRKKLTAHLNLPDRISSNALLDVLNTLYSYEAYKEMIDKLK